MRAYKTAEGQILTSQELSNLKELHTEELLTIEVPDAYFQRPPLEEMKHDLLMWAGRNKSVFEDDGEVGFGRPCVGILNGTLYINTGPIYDSEYRTVLKVAPEGAAQPREVEDAYHKHTCLCVLGRGEYAIWQLWFWVENIKRHDLVVDRLDIQPRDALDMILNGTNRPYLRKRTAPTHN